MKAVVLAAGKGVRMAPLTNDRPKALVELAGKTLVERVLETLAGAGVTEVLIVTGHLEEMVKEKLGQEFGGMRLKYIKQAEQSGTANAIGLAKEFVGTEGFVCTYCDVISKSSIFKELFDAANGGDGNSPKAIVVGREVSDPWRFGVMKVKDGLLEEIVEKPAKGNEPSNLINAGIYWFSPNIFGAIERTEKSSRNEFEITDSLNELAKENKVQVIEYTGLCLDIGTVKDLEQAKQKISKN
ncbi:MAG: sugar phosphate nucleotidyltransferase [archaeon]|jgi:bifunctional UDP-N-acetylglucosamine pyrophosphorylase/glucosamine-1-phosphate N-acetyltransferase|nr:sugar phosphate nucleotidyltransferase [archaeon]